MCWFTLYRYGKYKQLTEPGKWCVIMTVVMCCSTQLFLLLQAHINARSVTTSILFLHNGHFSNVCGRFFLCWFVCMSPLDLELLGVKDLVGHSSWEVSNLYRYDGCSNDCGKRAVRQAHHTLCTGICSIQLVLSPSLLVVSLP